MPTWPSPSSERLGTPKIPAIRFTRGTYFGASRFTSATACQVARPPLTDRTRSPRPQRAFTSRLPAAWSPSLPLDITTTWTGLPLLAGLAPARMAVSLAAPDPYVRNSRIRLPPRVFDGKPLVRPGVKDFRLRQPVVSQLRHPSPRSGVLLATPPEAASPQTRHVIAEGAQRRAIGRHGVVGEEPSDDLLQPAPLFGDRLMHPPSQLFLNFLELCAHAVWPGLPLELELALPGLAADEREAKETEGLRFAEPALRACDRCKAAKLDQAGLLRMQRQRELPQPCTHRVPEAPGLGFLLKADNKVSRAGESHPRALAEPDVRLSPHPAPIVQPRPCRSGQWANSNGCRRATRAIQCAVCRR